MYLNKYFLQVKSLFGIKAPETATKDLVEARKKLYSSFFTNEHDLYFDVGANMGNRIEPLVNMGIKIVAVEPQQSCVDFLNKKYADRIVVVPKGLSEKEGVLDMFIADESTISSFSQEWIESTKSSGRFKRNNWDKKVQVEITTLDKVIADHGHPKFIKIDVEGFELNVLKGLSSPVEYISYEYVMPERKQAVVDCMEQILKIAGDKKVAFNYSIGESMDLFFTDWIDEQQMRAEIDSKRFLKSSFGDVYAKTYL